MLRYTKEQVVILFAIAALFAAAALWKLWPQASAAGGSFPRPAYAYELAGDVRDPGIYRFDSPQTLGSLLSSARTRKAAPEQPGQIVANGSRIVVGSAVLIEAMRARDRLNCFLPLALESATAEDLELIPGMGEKTARAIIAYRERSGGFSTVSELTRVRGIGTKKLERFRPYLVVAY